MKQKEYWFSESNVPIQRYAGGERTSKQKVGRMKVRKKHKETQINKDSEEVKG